MIRKIKKIIKLITDFKTTRVLLSYRFQGYFTEIGWFVSLKAKRPLNQTGEPIPWTTYSYTYFIKNLLTKKMDVFEYGSGNSTLFYAKYVKSVIAVEHDLNWYQELKKDLPKNVTLIHQPLDYHGDYCRVIKQSKQQYDIIIIDGRDRNSCINNSLHSLKPNGIIVLDDSERKEYRKGIEQLLKYKFKRIDFWGFAPNFFQNRCTSVFYKNKILQIS